MQQILSIGAISCPAGYLPEEIAPQLPTDWNVGHVSLPVIFPPDYLHHKGAAISRHRKIFWGGAGERHSRIVPVAKGYAASVDAGLTAAPYAFRMEIMRFWAIATICLGLAIAAGLRLAQIAGKPAAPSVQPSTQMPPPSPQPKEASPFEPQEISHEEMVKEQERRDRQAEEERDRDDQ